MGQVRGIALEPLHAAAAQISRRDPELAERLALVDGLRLGDARVRGLAAKLLGERLTAAMATIHEQTSSGFAPVRGGDDMVAVNRVRSID